MLSWKIAPCSGMAGVRRTALAVCIVLLVAQCSTAVQVTYTDTGTSTLTPTAFPLPSGSVAYLHLRFQFIGGDVITNRTGLESALKAALIVAPPPGIAVRLGDYFTYPSTSPGYANYSSIVYDSDLWSLGTVYPDEQVLIKTDSQTLPQAIYQSNQFIQQLVASKFKGLTDVAMTGRYYHKTALKGNATENRTPVWADTLSRIQLTGADLLPFAADKATAFTNAVFIEDAGSNIYSINVSDFTTANTTSNTRKLLQASTPTVVMDVWTNSQAANFTPSGFWDGIFASKALQSVGPQKANWTGTFLNATVFLSDLNETAVGTVFDPPRASTAGAADESGDSDSLSAGAIAGIVIAALVAAAAIIAVGILAYIMRKRSVAKREDARHAAAAGSESSLDSSDDGRMGKAAAMSGPDMGVPHAQRAVTAAIEKASLGNSTWKPQLSTSDIHFSTNAAGKRVVLGGGAFSTVYQGRHLHRDVAVKVLQLDAGLAHAVQREVELAERVSRDANVVQVYGAAASADGQSVLLVMELMQGGDLRAALDGPQGSQYMWRERGAGIAADIACGLAYIHTTGVVHRDLKSSNVLLGADGRTAKVADIGAARLMDAEYVSQHFGTLAWAAPELLRADRNIQLDEKADSYSLGVLMWELVTGETPVRGSMRPVRVPGECPAAVAELIDACMAEAPAARPDADSVGTQLQWLAGGRE